MKRILLHIPLLCLLPALAMAQADALEQQLTKVAERYASEQNILVTQQLLFALDSVNAVPFDSGYCHIEKRDSLMHYRFNEVESFSDGEYVIRISNPARYMVVSRQTPSEDAGFGMMFSQAVAGFSSVTSQTTTDGHSLWKLSGGTAGIASMEILIDAVQWRIQRMAAELSADHPLSVQASLDTPGIRHTVFITIAYSYGPGSGDAMPQLADYLELQDGRIQAAEGYADFHLKVIE